VLGLRKINKNRKKDENEEKSPANDKKDGAAYGNFSPL
jgi:hypothetical protein